MATRKKTPARKTATPKRSPRARTAAKKTTSKKPSTKKGASATSTAATRKSTQKPTHKLTAAEQLREYQRKRDFEKTAEPSGATTRKSATRSVTKSATKSTRKSARKSSSAGELRFVIQKHDASHLHYDLRLEMDGVMKSWAVPKGPSADPSVKRLAMQVEDHPIEYNTFEGTIPAGEYGGGTVMLWDNGTYEIENAPSDDQNEAAHDQYERGELKIDFHGKRIKGSYALVRTRGMGGSSAKPSWLLIKHKDDQAHPEADSVLTEKYVKSVTTNRTMDEIGQGSRVWHSSR
jgi:bifunctional non-homologous end joining protein LigD